MASSPSPSSPSLNSGSVLQFDRFQSLVDVGFWHRLSSLKLETLGIDQSPITLVGKTLVLFLLLILFPLFYFILVFIVFF